MPIHQLLERIRHDWQAIEPNQDTAPMLTFITLRRASELLGTTIEHTAFALGLNSGTRDVLFTLYRSSDPDGRLSASDLAQALAVTPASITNRLDKLEERGLIERQLDMDDRRSWRIGLTVRGRALIKQHLPEHLARERSILSALSQAEIEQLESLLLRLMAQAETMVQE